MKRTEVQRDTDLALARWHVDGSHDQDVRRLVKVMAPFLLMNRPPGKGTPVAVAIAALLPTVLDDTPDHELQRCYDAIEYALARHAGCTCLPGAVAVAGGSLDNCPMHGGQHG